MSSFEYFFNDRLAWDLKWTISQKLYRAKEDARGMGAINIVPFWPVKGMGTNSMKELEFYEITIFVKHSANIIVRHIVNSIIFILTDSLWWYWLQHVEAQLTDHYLPKDRNACIRHHLCLVNKTSCKKAHKNPTIISIHLLWYFIVLICLKLPLLGVNCVIHSLQKPHHLFN